MRKLIRPRSLGLSSAKSSEVKNIIFSNKGGPAEQFVGQQLRAAQAPLSDPQLFHWQRTGGRQGEIDYIIQHGNSVVPIEVKSGKAGSMKSLHHFMAEKDCYFAVRCNMRNGDELTSSSVRLFEEVNSSTFLNQSLVEKT